MPITAYSHEFHREVDLEQWLMLNDYSNKNDLSLKHIPSLLREKATIDIECSGCQARGAMLVAAGKQNGNGCSVKQGHFRFAASEATNPHHPFCDLYFDEAAPRDTGHLVNFASDRSALTRIIRDLVSRGIRAKYFGQSDIRQMRLWFLKQKQAHSLLLNVDSHLSSGASI